MKIAGKVWKSRKDQFWLAQIPLLSLMVQAETKEEIPSMAKDAIELLVNDPKFVVEATLSGKSLFIESNNDKKLMGLILKRQRRKNNLSLEDVQANLGAKSINEYSQYERGKHLPSFDKFEQLLKAIDPVLSPVLSLR
jgi:hypothetical protein